MRISLIIPSFYPATVYGGPIFSTLYACEQLAMLGAQVRVSTTNTNMYSRLDVPTNKFIDLRNFKVKYYNETVVDKISIPLLFNIGSDIKNADVVHLQSIFNTPVPVSLFWALTLRKPVMLSPRGVLNNFTMGSNSKFKQTWLKLFIKPIAHKVVWHVTSELEQNDVISFVPQAKNFAIIPNGISLDEYTNIEPLTARQFADNFGLPFEPQKVVVSMGRIHQKKGFDVLIKAFSIIVKTEQNVALLIAGKDEGELKNLNQLISELGLENQVKFVGELKDEQKRSFLAGANVFCLPSHNENFGNVYAEALACGTPIVASPETPWMGAQNANCGLVVPRTPEANAQAIVNFFNTPKHLIEPICRNYISTFSWKSIGKQFYNKFEEMLSNK